MSRTDPETADIGSSEPIVFITVPAPAEASLITPRVGFWTTAVHRSTLLLIACSRDHEMLLLMVATYLKNELGSLTLALYFAALCFLKPLKPSG